MLSTPHLLRLVGTLKQCFDFSDNFQEFCIEANPNDKILSRDKLECFKQIGVTRLSMGVQSLSNDLLQLNGRFGDSETFRRVYFWARDLAFNIINLDFISGLRGENWDNWRRQIDQILELAPDNIAIYKLEMYLNTELSRKLRKRERGQS
jgi:coproporphyrinogen III oxidase-like Fe-S oxidoreductase